MSYVRINANLEYDPQANLVREGGKVREAGLAALAFSSLLEVQEQVRANAAAVAGETASSPGTSRPAAQAGANPTSSEALNPPPAVNAYQGPAARNPYFATAENPLREGRVTEFGTWFEIATVGAQTGSNAFGYRMRVATEQGAREALRLVQEWSPEAALEASVFGAAGGPWRADKPTYYIVLPNGEKLDAASLLASYYNHGRGVTVLSDIALRNELSYLTGNIISQSA